MEIKYFCSNQGGKKGDDITAYATKSNIMLLIYSIFNIMTTKMGMII
jgi:hypothetical protein